MARISQEEMDRRIAKYGGSALTHAPSVRKVKVPNPNRGLGEGQDALAPKELDVDVQQWTGADGLDIEAYQLPDGSWEIVKEQPATPKPSTSTTKPAIPPGGSSETEGTPIKDASGNITGWDNNRPREVIKDKNGTVIHSEELTGPDLTAWRNNQQANQPQTNTGEIPVTGRPGWTEIKTEVKTPQGTTTKSQFRGPDGVVVNTLPAEAPKPQQGPNGSWGYWDTTKTPPTWVAIQGGPGQATPTPTQVNGQWGYWKPGENGAAPTWTTVKGPEATRPPSSVGRFTPDPTKPQMGLGEYRATLAELRALGPQNGGITEEQYLAASKEAYEAAVAEASRLDTLVTAQQAAAQDAITQRGQDIQASTSRLASANSATQDALTQSRSLAGSMTPQGVASAGGPVLPAIMALQDMRGQSWGGFHQPPQVGTQQFPAWNQVAGMGLGGPVPSYGEVNAANQGAMSGFNSAIGPLIGAPPPAATPHPGMAGPAPVQPVFTPQPPAVYPGPAAAASPAGPPARDDWRLGAGQTIPGIAAMDPVLGSVLGDGSDPEWQEAVMLAARSRGLA